MNFDFADMKPGLYNVLAVTLMAAVGIVFFKWLFNRWTLPGVTEFFNAV